MLSMKVSKPTKKANSRWLNPSWITKQLFPRREGAAPEPPLLELF